ncbi:metal ABC transporter substrate-binding protein [Actinoplanes xinjiangensis]|uniref:metal ABC transporter substrate-binding protein n=1 Tax=Actinoplanes xinjiangensis TaxID=512350 RepID=UPI00341F59B2
MTTSTSSWVGRLLRPYLGAVACAAVLAGCASGTIPTAEPRAADAPLQVVASVAPITDIVRRVAGDQVTLTGAIPEGVDSHTFRPQQDLAALISEADVIFLNGLSLEKPVMELADIIGVPSDRVVRLGDAVVPASDYRYDFSFPQSGGKPNPHAWMSPLLGRAYARVVADELCRRAADDCALFRANLRAFEEQVDRLDTAMRTAFATIPGAKRLLTYHDAYAYFAAEYGWEVVGAVQPADFGRPSPAEVDGLVRQIRDTGVSVLFGSEMFPSSVVQQLAHASGARYVTDLSDDDLPGEPGDADNTYLAMLVDNYATITEQLGGDAAALRSVPVGAVRS